MISVILYGRNDDYGYNLHKRAALSLNCIAHVLDDRDDEIIFVDYNTPDDFPTFPEAIRDTLTPRAQSLLRIFRVRPAIHRRYHKVTHLAALEPIARNIGVRRSNPTNRWVLSTNTDMIFVPKKASSLSELASNLQACFYHAPRYDLPESLWETFDRLDPEKVITEAEVLGESVYLNEIVLGADHLLYDAPGDFQLVERRELFAIHGFCESMLLGWHVDANLAKRLYLRHGRVGDLASCVRAYHCEHTRSYSTMHYTKSENDIDIFVDHIEEACIPAQGESWGLAKELVEEISLLSCPSMMYLQSLTKAIPEQQLQAPELLYSPETFNLINYDPQHVLPYLADIFVNLPRNWSVGWLGANAETLSLFGKIWEQLGFSGKIFLAPDVRLGFKINSKACRLEQWEGFADKAQIFVFDFADLTGKGGICNLPEDLKSIASALLSRFFSLVFRERLRYECERRRVVFVNAINNDFEKLSEQFLLTVRTPMTSRIRHGSVVPEGKDPTNWLGMQFVGAAGTREGDQVRFHIGTVGHVVYGPYLILEPGHYRATVGIVPDETSPKACCTPPLVVEIVSDKHLLSRRDISWHALKDRYHLIDLEISVEVASQGQSLSTELRVWTSGDISGRIICVQLEKLSYMPPGGSSC